jgi:hypothetical protein
LVLISYRTSLALGVLEIEWTGLALGDISCTLVGTSRQNQRTWSPLMAVLPGTLLCRSVPGFTDL